MKAPFLFLLLLCLAKSGVASRATETYQDIIDKAFTLSLQRDRAHAIQVLTQSLKKESSKGPPPQELLVALEEVASSFYSDKTQQYFEQALSFRRSEPARSLQKLGEALKFEPDNLQILTEQVRLQIMTGDCGSAATNAEKLFSDFQPLEISRLALAQASLCAGKLDRVRKAKESIDSKKSSFQVYWNMVEAELAHRAGQNAAAKEFLSEALKYDPGFPETQFWFWKFEGEMVKVSERAAQKYLSLCKSLSPRAARKYLNEPLLCRRTAEVETFLKKNNSAGL